MANNNTQRQNTPTEQNKEDNNLVLYRLAAVETALNALTSRFDRLDNISKSDLKEFQSNIKEMVSGFRVDIQKQLDSKADKDQVEDLRSLVKAVGFFLSTIIAGIVVFYVTTKH